MSQTVTPESCLRVHSEVAILHFVSQLGLPVPDVVVYEDRVKNHFHSPYIVQEAMNGVLLSNPTPYITSQASVLSRFENGEYTEMRMRTS
jgi:hypothetical protein